MTQTQSIQLLKNVIVKTQTTILGRPFKTNKKCLNIIFLTITKY